MRFGRAGSSPLTNLRMLVVPPNEKNLPSALISSLLPSVPRCAPCLSSLLGPSVSKHTPEQPNCTGNTPQNTLISSKNTDEHTETQEILPPPPWRAKACVPGRTNIASELQRIRTCRADFVAPNLQSIEGGFIAPKEATPKAFRVLSHSFIVHSRFSLVICSSKLALTCVST